MWQKTEWKVVLVVAIVAFAVFCVQFAARQRLTDEAAWKEKQKEEMRAELQAEMQANFDRQCAEKEQEGKKVEAERLMQFKKEKVEEADRLINELAAKGTTNQYSSYEEKIKECLQVSGSKIDPEGFEYSLSEAKRYSQLNSIKEMVESLKVKDLLKGKTLSEAQDAAKYRRSVVKDINRLLEEEEKDIPERIVRGNELRATGQVIGWE